MTQQPDKPGLYFLQAGLFVRMKEPEKAEDSLKHAVELDSKNANTLILLGQLQARRNETAEAISTYQRALAINPNDAGTYIALGSLQERAGDWQNAESNYQKALALDSENAAAANNLAYLMLEHDGNVSVALSLAQTARKGFPNLANSADTLGWAYYHNAAYSVAAPLFEEAVKKAPNNQAYHYHLALTYQKLNDAAKAKTELEKAIALDPKSAVAGKAREALGSSGGD
jgi:Flp pilus assembly protein TadD